ncbi:MAG: FAD-dependent oxidoreductase, partial [bacterium]
MKSSVTVIGAGLAGVEAAYYLANRGIDVIL